MSVLKECGRPRVGHGNGRVRVTHSEGDDVLQPPIIRVTVRVSMRTCRPSVRLAQ